LVNSVLTTRAVRFIDEHKDQPFFLYYASTIPHTHITPAATFRGTSPAGLYGDYIQELDAHVKQILDALARHQLTQNTLVIFTSDNGGALNDFKGSADYRLNLSDESGQVREKYRTAKADAKAAGHSTNGPLSGGKGSVLEGGHRVPFIVRWPGRVPAGTVSHHLIGLTDLLATIAGLFGETLPPDAGEDSFDIGPAWLGDPVAAHPPMVAHGGYGQFAIRDGSWKLIEAHEPTGSQTALYFMDDDLAETTNRADQHPDIVQRLTRLLTQCREGGRSRQN
jgi:arylsulfatase A-like enzyme